MRTCLENCNASYKWYIALLFREPPFDIVIPWWLSGKESAYQECRRPWFDPWVWKIPWRRKWLPPPVFLLGKSHRQRSLASYSPWGCKELDTTWRLNQTTMIIQDYHYTYPFSFFLNSEFKEKKIECLWKVIIPSNYVKTFKVV